MSKRTIKIIHALPVIIGIAFSTFLVIDSPISAQAGNVVVNVASYAKQPESFHPSGTAQPSSVSSVAATKVAPTMPAAASQALALSHTNAMLSTGSSTLGSSSSDSDVGTHQQSSWSGGGLPQGGALSISHEDGSVSYTLPVGNAFGTNITFPLQLMYNSSNNDDLDGAGTGWSWGIPTVVDTQTQDTSDKQDTFNLFIGNGDSYTLGAVNTETGQYAIVSSPSNGNYNPMEVFACQSNCTLPHAVSTKVYTDDKNGSPVQTTVDTWDIKIVWPNSGKTAYLKKIGTTESGFNSYLGKNTDPYWPVSSSDNSDPYDLIYYRTVMMVNSHAALHNDQYSYITFDYQSFFLNGEKLQNGDNYSYTLWVPKQVSGYTYGVNANNQQFLHQDSTITFSYTEASGEQAVPGSSSQQGKVTVNLPTGAQAILNVEGINPACAGDDNCVTSGGTLKEGNPSYPDQSYKRHYPSRGLWQVMLQDNGTKSPLDPIAGKQYVYHFDYRYLENDFAQMSRSENYSSNSPALPREFGEANIILSAALPPNGQMQYVNFLDTSWTHQGVSYKVAGLGEPQTIDELGTGHETSYGNNTPPAIYGEPYANEIFSCDPALPKAMPNYTFRQSLACEDPNLRLSGAKYNVDNAAYTNPYLKLSMPLAGHDVYAIDNGTSDSGMDPNIDPLWGLMDGGHWQANDPYGYGYTSASQTTSDTAREVYQAPHLLLSGLTNLATGDQGQTDYFYDNFVPVLMSENLDGQLSTNPYSFNMPTKTLSYARNQTVVPNKTLSTEQDDIYTPYGDVVSTTHADGSQVINYYNHQVPGDTSAYRHIVATVYLAAIASSADVNKGDDPNALDKKAYAYFVYYNVDPSTNDVTDTLVGYLACAKQTDGSYEPSCFSSDAATGTGYAGKTAGDFVSMPALYNQIIYQVGTSDTTANSQGVAQSWPAPHTQIVSVRHTDYDDYGRLSDDYRLSLPAASDFVGSASPTIKTANAITHTMYHYYLTSGQTPPSELANFNIDSSSLHLSSLPSANGADYWYVVGQTSNIGDTSGSSWVADPRTYTVLSIIAPSTGQLMQFYTGLEAANDPHPKQFARSTLYRYDTHGVLREKDMPELERATAMNYTFDAAPSTENSVVVGTYYCPDTSALVANVGSLAGTLQAGQADNTGVCQQINQTVSNSDHFNRITTVKSWQFDKNDVPTVLSSVSNRYYSLLKGGLLKSTLYRTLGQPIRQTTPLYDASHRQIGSLSQIYQTDGKLSREVPSYTNHKSNQSAKAYVNKGYELSLSNIVANQEVSYDIVPCTSASGEASYCAKYMSIEQHEAIDQQTTDPVVSANSLYSSGANRLLSSAMYRASASNGYPIDVHTLEAAMSGNGKNDDLMNNAQTLINELLKNAYQQQPSPNANSSDWKLSSYASYLYDIYDQLTTTEQNAYVQQADGQMVWKHKIMHRYYDKYHRLIKVSNVDLNNEASNGGLSADDGATDISSTYTYYNRINQATQIIHYAAKNSDDWKNAQNNADQASSYREKDFLRDSFGKAYQVTDCGQNSGREGACSTLSDSTRTRLSTPSYDYLSRLTAFVSNPQTVDAVTHHIIYYSTGELKGTWATLNDSGTALAAVQPICFIYDFAYSNLTGMYYNPTAGSCSYQSLSAINDPGSVGLMTYNYDTATNQLDSVIYPESNAAKERYTISYDYSKNNVKGSLLEQLTDVDGFVIKPSYYNMAGQFSRIGLYDSNANEVAGVNGIYYDNENRVTQINLANKAIENTTTTQMQQYIQVEKDWDYQDSYDNKFTLLTKQDYFGQMFFRYRTGLAADNYSYDSEKRLITDKTDTKKSYEYDAMGNLSKDSQTTFASNGLDELTNAGYVYDAAGNLVRTPTACFSYNARNQLISAAAFSNNACDASTKVNYGIRVNGMRGSKMGPDKTGKEVVMRYFYVNGQLLNTILDDNGQLTTSHYLGRFARVVTGSTINNGQPLVQYLLTGSNGAVLGTFKDLNETTHQPALGYYDAYGNLTTPASSLLAAWDASNDDAVNNAFDMTKIPLGYDGEYTDIEGNDQGKNLVHIYLRHREYAPYIHRFTQADMDNRNFNRSAFVQGDPNDFIDPTGLHHNTYTSEQRSKHRHNNFGDQFLYHFGSVLMFGLGQVRHNGGVHWTGVAKHPNSANQWMMAFVMATPTTALAYMITGDTIMLYHHPNNAADWGEATGDVGGTIAMMILMPYVTGPILMVAYTVGYLTYTFFDYTAGEILDSLKEKSTSPRLLTKNNQDIGDISKVLDNTKKVTDKSTIDSERLKDSLGEKIFNAKVLMRRYSDESYEYKVQKWKFEGRVTDLDRILRIERNYGDVQKALDQRLNSKFQRE